MFLKDVAKSRAFSVKTCKKTAPLPESNDKIMNGGNAVYLNENDTQVNEERGYESRRGVLEWPITVNNQPSTELEYSRYSSEDEAKWSLYKV